MWLKDSSIGRKVVMSVTGLALVLFLTFHMSMNLVALFSPEAYNAICGFLGANWYALVGTMGLAFLFIVHIIYAFWLTVQNRKARGNERYAVVERRSTVTWASQNMLVLGIIVILGIGLHLYNFWYNMQFQEILGNSSVVLNGQTISVHEGAKFIQHTFSNPVFTVLYIIWLVAIWFHLTHGFWSSLQSIGLSNTLWIRRWKVISNIYSTIIVLGFAVVILAYAFCPAFQL